VLLHSVSRSWESLAPAMRGCPAANRHTRRAKLDGEFLEEGKAREEVADGIRSVCGEVMKLK
jgi:hypothetical protein